MIKTDKKFGEPWSYELEHDHCGREEHMYPQLHIEHPLHNEEVEGWFSDSRAEWDVDVDAYIKLHQLGEFYTEKQEKDYLKKSLEFRKQANLRIIKCLNELAGYDFEPGEIREILEVCEVAPATKK